MFARFDENPAMTLRVIKETKRYGRMDGRTDGRTDNVKTVSPLQTKFAGGIKTVPIFNLHEYSCLAPHTMNNYINKLSCLYIYRTKKLLARSTCVGPYLIIFP